MNMTNTKTCPICGKAVDPSRLAQHPNAVVCGRIACSKTYKREAFNKIRRRYRTRRLARDPAYRQREKLLARERYVLARLRLGKTPAEREPVASPRRAGDAFLSTISQGALAGLRRAARSVGAFCGVSG